MAGEKQKHRDEGESIMAVFLDLENLALGAHDAHFPGFDITNVLERLLVKGHIVVKKPIAISIATNPSRPAFMRPPLK